MLKFTRKYVWASCLACLAFAVAASGAFAEQEEDKDQAQQYEAQKPSDDDSQRQDQDRQRSEQEKQRAKQEQQRAKLEQQRDQQEQQRAQQSRSRFPEPNREIYGRDQEQWNRDREQYGRDQRWNRESQFSRDSQQSQRGGDEGGLGVSIARDGRGVGITVIRVHRDSPAEQMGLEEGDRITHLNGRQIESADEFISRIRNMNPGQQVEIDIQRDRDQRTFRGELESREQAIVLRGGAPRGQIWSQEGRGTRQTGYEEGGRFAEGQVGRSGDAERQLSQIERQLSQLSRAIEDLRYAVRDVRQQSARWGRETTAGYDEYPSRQPGQSRTEGSRMSGRSQDQERQYDGGREIQRSREIGSERGFDTERGQPSRQYDEGARSRQYEEGESIGGEIGEERLRPGAE